MGDGGTDGWNLPEGVEEMPLHFEPGQLLSADPCSLAW